MIKRYSPKIIEIHVHRSKKHRKLGHAVALLFPCSHNKYLGLTLYKGEADSNFYRAQDIRIIKVEDFSVTDKEHCKLCPHDDLWLDDLISNNDIEAFVEVLESVDDF